MAKVWAKIGTIFDRLITFLVVVSCVMLAFTMISITLNVIDRKTIGIIQWGGLNEISEYILLSITFLSAACLLKDKVHVRMDLVYDRLELKARAGLTAISYFIGALICFAITWYAAQNAIETYLMGLHRMAYLSPPSYILHSLIAFGSLLTCIQFLRETASGLREWKVLNKKYQTGY